MLAFAHWDVNGAVAVPGPPRADSARRVLREALEPPSGALGDSSRVFELLQTNNLGEITFYGNKVSEFTGDGSSTANESSGVNQEEKSREEESFENDCNAKGGKESGTGIPAPLR